MNVPEAFAYLVMTAAAAVALSWFLFRERGRRASAETELSIVKTELQESKDERTRLEAEKASLESRIQDKEILLSRLDAAAEQERKGFEEKLAVLDEAKKRLGDEFENLGNRIFEETAKKFSDRNNADMRNLLNPLREQITGFEKKVADTHEKASTDRASLKVHIENLKNLGDRMSREAVNLTTALRGEPHTRGAWGEMVLEKALEMSGLSEGREYVSQPSCRGSDGNVLRPDVIVRLPDGKDIVIDSKVSLAAYEGYASCGDEEERKRFLGQHVQSFRSHVRELGSRGYENIREIRSLNYVLMFVPLESAFMLALEAGEDIYSEAFARNVIIVCPSTLLATLRTIHGVWQLEHQNANAREIAESAGKMYDKFVVFAEHFEEIGKRIEQSDEAYRRAMISLRDGRGSLVKKASDLREMGAKTSKKLPPGLSDGAGLPGHAVSSGEKTD